MVNKSSEIFILLTLLVVLGAQGSILDVCRQARRGGLTVHDSLYTKESQTTSDRGLFTKTEIDADTILFKVPQRHMLEAETPQKLAKDLKYVSEAVSEQDGAFPWRNYFPYFPDDYETLPLTVSQKLKNKCMPPLYQRSMANDPHVAGVDLDEMDEMERKAFLAQHTRAFRLSRPTAVPSSSSLHVSLIPCIDVANHRAKKPNARLEHVAEGAILITTQTIHPDEEIFIDYGIRDPLISVEQFGFLNESEIEYLNPQASFPPTMFPESLKCEQTDYLYYNAVTGEPSEVLFQCVAASNLQSNVQADVFDLFVRHGAQFSALPWKVQRETNVSAYKSIQSSIRQHLGPLYLAPKGSEEDKVCQKNKAVQLAVRMGKFVRSALRKVIEYCKKKLTEELKEDL
eukprot:PhF_6_TR34216/c0_g1_i1/m.50176